MSKTQTKSHSKAEVDAGLKIWNDMVSNAEAFSKEILRLRDKMNISTKEFILAVQTLDEALQQAYPTTYLLGKQTCRSIMEQNAKRT